MVGVNHCFCNYELHVFSPSEVEEGVKDVTHVLVVHVVVLFNFAEVTVLCSSGFWSAMVVNLGNISQAFCLVYSTFTLKQIFKNLFHFVPARHCRLLCLVFSTIMDCIYTSQPVGVSLLCIANKQVDSASRAFADFE